MGRGDNVNSARTTRSGWKPHPNVLKAVRQQPAHLQVPLLASALVESGGRPDAVGDGGNSGGAWQENTYGRGAGIPMQQRFDPFASAKRAAEEFQRFYDQGKRGARLAYSAQRPADQSDYEKKVKAAIPFARRLLNSQGATQVDGSDETGTEMERVSRRVITGPGTLTPESQAQLNKFLEASRKDVEQGRYDGNKIYGLVDNLRFDTPTAELWEEVPNANNVQQPDGPSGFDLTPRGGFKGTQGLLTDIKNMATQGTNVQVTSEKRNNKNPASGSRSDHDHGNKDAYAFDLSDGSNPTPNMDRVASRIVRALGGGKDWGKKGGNFTKEINGVRYQVLYRTDIGGNHWNHVHVGAKRVG